MEKVNKPVNKKYIKEEDTNGGAMEKVNKPVNKKYTKEEDTKDNDPPGVFPSISQNISQKNRATISREHISDYPQKISKPKSPSEESQPQPCFEEIVAELSQNSLLAVSNLLPLVRFVRGIELGVRKTREECFTFLSGREKCPTLLLDDVAQKFDELQVRKFLQALEADIVLCNTDVKVTFWDVTFFLVPQIISQFGSRNGTPFSWHGRMHIWCETKLWLHCSWDQLFCVALLFFTCLVFVSAGVRLVVVWKMHWPALPSQESRRPRGRCKRKNQRARKFSARTRKPTQTHGIDQCVRASRDREIRTHIAADMNCKYWGPATRTGLTLNRPKRHRNKSCNPEEECDKIFASCISQTDAPACLL